MVWVLSGLFYSVGLGGGVRALRMWLNLSLMTSTDRPDRMKMGDGLLISNRSRDRAITGNGTLTAVVHISVMAVGNGEGMNE